jgi:NADPH2 dehydrogenase
MGMADLVPTFSHILSELKRLHPTLAYIHVIEPTGSISADSSVDASPQNAGQSNDFIRDIWGDRPLISGGGFTHESGIKLAEERKISLVAYGRHFIANVRRALSCVKRLLTQRFCVQPDLPVRLQKNIPLHPYDRPTFYLPGLDAPTGYTDQPFATPAA